MTKINYTTSSDARNCKVTHPLSTIQIELQGLPEEVEAIATLLRQQTEIMGESDDNKLVEVSRVCRNLVVKRIITVSEIVRTGAPD